MSALERVNQVLRFDFSKGFTRARGEVVPLPPAVRKLPYNKGLEALVMVPKGLPLAGTLIAISERGLDADGNLIAFPDRRAGTRAVQRPPHRQFRRQRRGAAAARAICCCWSGNFPGSTASASGSAASRSTSLAPGAVVDGPAIFEADLGQEIDNMEGIDAHVTEEGDTVLTMVSDDNFSMIQRTLLLQFTLVE